MPVLPRPGGPRPAVGVLGTHPAAVQHAQLVRQWSHDLIFFAHTYDLTPAEVVELEARAVQVVHGVVARLVVEADRLTGAELADGRVVDRTAVFVRPNIVPHADGLLARLGCEFTLAGFVAVDGTGRTSTAGVWAAGNAADPRRLRLAGNDHCDSGGSPVPDGHEDDGEQDCGGAREVLRLGERLEYSGQRVGA